MNVRQLSLGVHNDFSVAVLLFQIVTPLLFPLDPGNCHCIFRFSAFGHFEYLVWVESCNICLLIDGDPWGLSMLYNALKFI